MPFMFSELINMGTWNLACHCSRMLVQRRLLTCGSNIRFCSQYAFYHCTSLLLCPKDRRAKPVERWRRSAFTSSGLLHISAVSELQQHNSQSKDLHDNPKTRVYSVQRTETLRTPKRKPNGHRKEPQFTGREPPIHREKKPNPDCRLSTELHKLSFDDFPDECDRQLKYSRRRVSQEEDQNYETLFGVSPCLLALTQGRRKSHRLFVKEGETSRRASVQQVCEEAQRQGIQIQRVSKMELTKMCSGGVHQGLCLHASPLRYLIEDQITKIPEDSSHTPLWLVLDRVQDPMNLGAILRSAYFLGVDRVASSLRYSCPLTPVVSKASSGVMEVMGLYGYDSLTDMLKVKVAQGWQVIGTVGAEAGNTNVPIMQCSNFRMTKPTLLLMGGEGEGLSQELRLLCETLLTIPARRNLHPGVESLNVSVATGILLHSLLSSRRGGHP
ncbi:hypothetical protein UPYG_G00118840 [Umbra pygmaea]|uniref:rRNA methyltransferase 1, mitochondrial n=1 Tax=Umbra pygmaea TaxID=75934 RepID=A0ABD0XU42_UMBPY